MRALQEKEVLTTGEVARICHVAPRTVSKWFDTGKLRGYRIPGSRDRRIPREQLMAFMRAHGIPMDSLEDGCCRVLIVGTSAPSELAEAMNATGRFEVRTAENGFEAGVLAQQFRPHVVVLDAIVGMQGLGEYPGDSIPMGLVAAGEDALSVDCVGARLMGMDPNTVLHLRFMAEREGADIEHLDIRVLGESLETHRKTFTTGFQVFSDRFPQVTILQGRSACTGCTSELVTALTYLDRAGYSPEMQGLHVAIGDVAEVRPVPHLALLGRCTSAHEALGVYVPGCPPREEEVVMALCDACRVNPARVLEVRNQVREEMWRKSDRELET